MVQFFGTLTAAKMSKLPIGTACPIKLKF